MKSLFRSVFFLAAVLLPCSAAYVTGQESSAVADTVLRGSVVPMNGVFLRQLQERDSILVADQLYYGVDLEKVKEGTQFVFPEIDAEKNAESGLMILSDWHIDTLKVRRQKKGEPKLLDLQAGIVLTSFMEGDYVLNPVTIQRISEFGVVDTLVFEPQKFTVTSIPVDTATFQVHDIKGQIRYPLTLAEVLPYVFGGQVLAVIVILIVCLIMMSKKKSSDEDRRKDPAHIVALRKLDGYRGDRLWAAEKQKTFYSGVTDTLREYIVSRYGISAMEMTTKEIFDGLSGTDVPEGIYAELRSLFERADYVKFAKYVASDDENAAAVPLAVRFVTSTYQSQVEEDPAAGPEDVVKPEDEKEG